jgi:general secretion pathway protein K
MSVPPQERGAALLTVLLLVAVMATIAAAALDRIGVGTRFIANASTASQARAWLEMAEQLTATRIEDRIGADGSPTTLAGGWLGVERDVDLPDGSTVHARVEDGSNCFNLNSLVQRLPNGQHVARPLAARQFAALMASIGINEGEASGIAAAATDYIDPDSQPLPGGGEDDPLPSANQLMADPSELRLLPNVTDRHYGLLERWVCALPMTELSAINVNTLLPEQAPLLAMLLPGRWNLARARAQITSRPTDGFGSVLSFWRSPALAGIEPPAEAAEQVKVRTSFFVLRARVKAGEMELAETALFDARHLPVRLVRRQWGQTI